MVFALPAKGEDGIAQLSILTDKQPVQYKVMQRAISIHGKDVSTALMSLGLPLNPVAAMHNLDMSRNRDSIIPKLHSLNLIDEKEETPNWTVKSYYYWQQSFAPRSQVAIEQIYKPQVAAYNIKLNNFTEILKLPLKIVKKIVNVAINWTLVDNNAAESLQNQFEKYSPHIKRYCPAGKDYQTLVAAYKKQPDRDSIIEMRELHFAHTNDDMWAHPIGRFSLTIEAPKNFHALACWQDDLKRTGNGYRFSAENYVPLQDLNVLYVEK
jgi:hypothetical protein